MKQRLEDLAALEVRLTAIQMNEAAGKKAAVLVVRDADAPAAALDQLAAVATACLSGRRTFSAIDARNPSERQTRLSSTLESFPILDIDSRLLTQRIEQRLRTLVRSAEQMKPGRHLTLAEKVRLSLAKAQLTARYRAPAATALRSSARCGLKDVRHRGSISDTLQCMKSLGSRAAGARLERMRASPRWAGEGFRNLHPILPGLRDPNAPMPSLKDFLCGRERGTPSRALPSLNPLDVWKRTPDSELRVTWLGHSTTLIEIEGVRVLTDPVWGPRASPLALAGPKRFQPVPVPLRAMPAVDLVVISHDHYDHLDYPTIRALAKSDVPFVTSLGVGAHLEGWGIAPERITELDWWESYEHPTSGVRVTAAPSQHFSGRTLKSRNATLWSSMVVRSGRHCVFFSGDTGLTTEYQNIRERLGPFDLAMLEVGAWNAAWGDMHLGPENALKAVSLLDPGAFLPIHWGTFRLAMHAWDQPAEVLFNQASTTRARLVMPKLGEPFEPTLASGRVEPWWRGVDGLGNLTPPVDSGSRNSKLPRAMPWPVD